MRDSDVSKIQAKVAHALLRACVGADLAVSSPSGLSGGSVIGEAVEAYVVTEPSLG